MAVDLDAAALARRLRRLYPSRGVRHVVEVTARSASVDLMSYRDRPVEFCRDVLGVELTPDQQAIISARGRVKVNAGHSVGKTFLAACVLVHRFHTRERCFVITTAPTQRDVIDLLWTEVRLMHQRARVRLPDYFIGPRAPELFHTEEHQAKGYTASRGESFQGRHRECMVFIFDECEGLDPIYWQTTDTMYKPEHDHLWLAIGNPVTTSSQSYLEDLAVGPDGRPKWNLFTLSALNHPNVHAELAGLPAPVPNAVSLAQVNQWLKDWADVVPADDVRETDIQWPPGSNTFHRPGPLFKGRVLGERPLDGVNTIWGQVAWRRALDPKFSPAYCWERNFGITIGCDVATYGDDDSVLHVRTGPLSLHHERHNGWLPKQLSDRIKALCIEWSLWYNQQALIPTRPQLLPKHVKVIVELDGAGVGVLERCDGFGNWSGLKVAEASEKLDMMGRPMYANKRAEIWFESEKKARQGEMDLSRLPQEVLDRLRHELLTPSYKLQPSGTLLVEPKEHVKERLKRSPDNADGLLVAYTDAVTWAPKVLAKSETDY